MQTRFSFPQSCRLIASADFQLVRRKGIAFRGKLMTLGVLAGQKQIRVGFITSKRVGGAVLRNRTRRRLREIFRHHRHEIVGGSWIVTIASAKAARASYRSLEDDWLHLAERASILATRAR